MSFGKVVQVMGPSVDIQLESDTLPPSLNALEIEVEGRKSKLVLEVAQHTGDNVVRCIALASTDGLVRGMKAKDTGAPISVPVGEQTLGRIFNLLGEPIDGQDKPLDMKKKYNIHRPAPTFEDLLPVSEVLETGIKVVDLLAPYAKGRRRCDD